MITRVMVSGIAAVSLVLGCKDPFTVDEVAGTYSLAAMDARALPQLISATLTCDEWVQGGDLTLQPSGEFMLLVRGELDCTRGGGQVQMAGWEYPGTYSVSGTTLQFVSPTYPSGELHFAARIDRLGTRVRVPDVDLGLSTSADLEFRR